MKTIITSLTLLLITSFSFSQTFSWVTTNTIETNLATNTTVQLRMDQQALNGNTVTLGIEVIHNDLPSTWDGMICVYGTCFGAIQPVGFTGQMSPFQDPEQGFVRLTVNPQNSTEEAKLQIYVYDVNDPNNGDTATWLLNTTVGTGEIDPFATASIYPNPTTGDFTISTEAPIQKVSMFTVTGQVVLEEEINIISTHTVSTSNLPVGHYQLILEDNNGHKTMRKLVKK